MPMPSPGDLAPPLAGPTDDGTFDLAAHRGRPVVVYFYPRDATPGCTLEAQDFRDRAADFAAAGATIVGVSRDSVKSHAKFRAKECLPFPLVADESGAITESWGVWQEKSMYGKVSMGIVRSTFVVGADGRVSHAWPKVSVKGHADAVLAAILGA